MERSEKKLIETSGEMNMDSLYIAWREDRRSAAPKALREWVAQYPGQADALMNWAGASPILDYADKLPADAVGEKRVREIGQNIVAEMRAQYFAPTAVPPVSLAAAAKAQGMRLAEFARKVGVGLTVASKLDRRLIHAEQVPAECVRRIADALNLTANQIRAYLQQGPTLAQNAMYRADAAPQVADKQDFTAAIQSAADMSEEEKAFWLAEN